MPVYFLKKDPLKNLKKQHYQYFRQFRKMAEQQIGCFQRRTYKSGHGGSGCPIDLEFFTNTSAYIIDESGEWFNN